MKNLVTRFVREEEGQDLIEYSLLAALIAVACIAPCRRWRWTSTTSSRESGLRFKRRSRWLNGHAGIGHPGVFIPTGAQRVHWLTGSTLERGLR
jgi:Flp pilus assembly pilin Flp